MGRALSLHPFPDHALERAAATHYSEGRPTVGLFYLQQMKEPTQRPELKALAKGTRRMMQDSPL